MNATADERLFKEFRFLPAVIQYAVWLYFTSPLSYREVAMLLAQHYIQVSHETIRHWCRHFGPILARKVRRKRRRPTGKWHLDEVFIKMGFD